MSNDEFGYGRKPPIERNGRTYVFCNYYERYEAKDDSPPAVLCGECGHDTFKIGYGACECRAECTECGNSQVVYDG